ncbi:hypothetical protein K502DRAFT_345946 [Neoconidiobolus thromboides FSU 785]|nr:hypothetical protein K502DRAFT_349114 [Neoconidiobolus thromboides FSU 785]KAI9298508.1 hypothetical protein K502DRAFT_345946 [Neoconidiobolus thromboides FSU 785]
MKTSQVLAVCFYLFNSISSQTQYSGNTCVQKIDVQTSDLKNECLARISSTLQTNCRPVYQHRVTNRNTSCECVYRTSNCRARNLSHTLQEFKNSDSKCSLGYFAWQEGWRNSGFIEFNCKKN